MTGAGPTSLTMPKAVLFDLDGTLIDSAPDIAAAVNELLTNHSKPSVTVQQVAGMIGNGIERTIERAFAEVGSPLEGDELVGLMTEMAPIYRRHATKLTRLMPGASEALAKLHMAGIKIGLVTNKPQLATREVLLHFGILERFGAVIGGDAVTAMKPAPEALFAALEALGTKPAEALMVGDSLTDVEAARNAGMPVVVIRGGYVHQPIETLGADHVLDSMADLPELLLGVQQAA